MKLLAVETSTLTGAVACLDGPAVIGEMRLNIAVTHSERLLGAVDHLLTAARWRLDDLGGLVVAMGPGSFTGLRIGLSTMKGLAFATGKPLVGVPTLDALAWSLPHAAWPICPVLDAKKGEVYCALYRTDAGRLERLWDQRVLAPAALAAALSRDVAGPVVFLGDGIGTFGPLFREALGERARFGAASQRIPSAASLGELGQAALDRGEALDPAGLTPIYLRRSEAELARERRDAGDPR